MSDLAERWPLSTGDDVCADLLAVWSSPGRGYHDARHLAEVLDALAVLGAAAPPVLLAAWFHDAVYDGAADDEERSADLAESELGRLGVDAATVAEVGRLVRLTARHDPAPGDGPGAALCDADLAILAADESRYAEYVAGVRHEYARYDDATFAAGRAGVLRDLLAHDSLYRTDRGRSLWESRARRNVEAELARLDAVAGP